MTLSKERQGEIALAIIKLKFKKEGRMPRVQDFKREVGNVSKETGFSKEELTEFVTSLVVEFINDFVSELRKPLKS